jgi:hypothetical protein
MILLTFRNRPWKERLLNSLVLMFSVPLMFALSFVPLLLINGDCLHQFFAHCAMQTEDILQIPYLFRVAHGVEHAKSVLSTDLGAGLIVLPGLIMALNQRRFSEWCRITLAPLLALGVHLRHGAA